VIIVNGLFSVVLIAACSVIVPWAPLWMTIVILGMAGLSRSMQFTALSSVAFADIDDERRGPASTLISIVMQVTMVLAVAIATFALKLSQWARGGDAMALFDLQVAIGVMAVLALMSTILLLRLPKKAGDEIAGRAEASAP
jgi:MFS family permease